MTHGDGEKKYYSIGETSRITGVPEHSIRHWEKEFGLLRPVRKESGHRRYTAREIDALNEIKDLVYRRKMTLAGAKKHLSRKTRAESGGQLDGEALRLLEEIHKELSAILKE